MFGLFGFTSHRGPRLVFVNARPTVRHYRARHDLRVVDGNTLRPPRVVPHPWLRLVVPDSERVERPR
jgi:hypothetical protein